MRRLLVLAAAALLLVAAPAPAAALFKNGLTITPSEFNTCSNSSSDSAPQISRVETCARASVSGTGTGTAFSFTNSQANVVRVASDACGDAVAGSIGELCGGGDPMAAIFNVARTCATAMAALYTKSVTSNAVFDMGVGALKGRNATKEGRLTACGSGCTNAQGAAEAFAQAAACGVAKATDSCMAATMHVQTRAFSRAFVKNTADAWSRACATDVGVATSGGETIAVSAAASIAKAMGAVAAQACANCPTCRCKKLPLSFSWNDAGDFSDAAARVAAGRVGLARAIAGATTTFCRSNGTVDSAKANAGAVMDTFADMVVGALGAVRGYAHALGNASWACGSGTLESDLSAVKEVAAGALADAAGIVYDSWCPRAAAKFQQLQLDVADALQKAVNKTAEKCTGRGVGFGEGLARVKLGGQAADLAALLKTSHFRPLVKRVADALTEAKSCGCSGVAPCFWCDRGEALSKGPAPAPLPTLEAPGGDDGAAGVKRKFGLLSGLLAGAANATGLSLKAPKAAAAVTSSSGGNATLSSGSSEDGGGGSGGPVISGSGLVVDAGAGRKNLTAAELLSLLRRTPASSQQAAKDRAREVVAGILDATAASFSRPIVTVSGG